MSKYLEFADVVFKSQKLLLAALADAGYPEVEIDANGINLVGYQGDTRQERCEIVVRRKYIGIASNDLGFRLTPKGYVPIVSDFDTRAHGGRLVADINIAYGKRVVSELNKRLGLRAQRSETATALLARLVR